MSEKKHELYLIALALVIAAGLILYNVFQTPGWNPIVKPVNNTVAEQGGVESTETMAITGSVPDETAAAATTQAAAADYNGDNKPKPAGPVNINTATKEELMTLTGIGEVKAAAIIEYRRENGEFRSVDELNNVKGIGDKTLAKIRDKITV